MEISEETRIKLKAKRPNTRRKAEFTRHLQVMVTPKMHDYLSDSVLEELRKPPDDREFANMSELVRPMLAAGIARREALK